MKNIYQKIANLSAQTLVLSFLSLGLSSIVQAASFQGDRVVVANRESGTLSVIDTVSVLGLSEDHTPVPGSECKGCNTTFMLLKYSTQTFEEIDRLDVGVDPHLGLTSQNDLLYVAAQNSDVVTVLAREDFSDDYLNK